MQVNENERIRWQRGLSGKQGCEKDMEGGMKLKLAEGDKVLLEFVGGGGAMKAGFQVRGKGGRDGPTPASDLDPEDPGSPPPQRVP